MRGLFVVVVLIATLVSHGTAQLPFGPEFHLSQYQATEGETVVVRLSAPILTRPQIPTFTGSIEVDITAEDLPSGDPRQSALFGIDYLVNRQNPSARTFTVTFQSKQASSTENVIELAADDIVEGSEAFRLRIVAARLIGEAASIFRAQDGLNNTIADVTIEDDDFVEVSWIISEPIEVREGEGARVELFAQAFGLYATPIEIGVVCKEVDVTGVPPAVPGRDFVVLSGNSLVFTDVGTLRSNSSTSVVLSIINDDIAEPCESFICTLQGGAVDRVRGVEPNRVTVRICDDDELLVRWARDVYVFDESQIAGTVELVTDSTFEVAQVVIQGFPRQIPDGDPNRIDSLVVPGPAFPGFAFNATIERAFVRVPSPLFGGRIFGNAQVTQSGRSDALNTINDFVLTPNNTSGFENFTIVDDDVLEFDEIFIAVFSFGPEIANNWNARQVDPRIAFIHIRDDDSVVVNFSEISYTVAESDGQVSVSLRIDGKFFIPVWAVIEISDGTATDPEDYSSAMRYNVTFHQTAFTDGGDPADTALSSPILIDVIDDNVFDGVEYFQARIVETSNSIRVRIGQDTVNITITDSVTVRYEEDHYSAAEEAGYVTPALVLDGNASVPVTVSVRTLDLLNITIGDSATASVDYIPRGPFDITFQPGSTRELFNVTIVDDGIPENSEFFNADIVSAGPAGAIIGEPRQPVIEILDRVKMVTVRYEQERYSVEEEDGSVTLALVLDRAVPFPVTVIARTLDLLNSSYGDAATANVDYTPREAFEITFPAGSTRQEYTVDISDDSVPENSEFFNANVTARPEDASIVAIGSPKQPLIEIQDLRDALIVMFERDSYSVREDAGSLLYRVTANSTASFDYEVVITGTDGSAICGLDYHEPIDDSSGTDPPVMSCSYSLTITIPAGSSAGGGVVAIINDTIYEGPEDFFLDLSVAPTFQAVGINEGSSLRATVEIEDDDELRVFFDPAEYLVPEGENQVLLLRTDKNFTVPFTIDVTLEDGTAVAPGDYENRSYQVVFNVTTQMGTLVVHTETDNIIENDEDFTAVLSVPAGLPRVFEGTPSEATVSILDQTTAEVYFDPATYNVTEGQPVDIILRLTRDVDPSVTIIVRVQTRDGSATDGSDYTGGPFEVAFTAGVNVVSFNVPILDDAIAEYAKLFNLDLDIPAAAVGMGVIRGSPDTATIHVVDDDVEDLQLFIENADYMVKENAGSFVAAVIASRTADFDYTVTVDTSDGTAVGDDDFVSRRYQLVFPAGQTGIKFTVVITDDSQIEATESFQLLLSIPEDLISKGVQVGPNSASTVTIMDNDDDASHDKTAPCPTDKDSVWGIQWLAIAAGSIQSARCPGEGSSSVDGLAYRRCMTGMPAEWGSVNASECESVAGREVRKKTDEFLSSLDKSNRTKQDLTDTERSMFQNISHDLSAVLDPSDERNRSILPQDLKTAVKFVEVVADLGENNGLFREESNETEETVGDILSNVLDERNAPAFEATAQTDSTDPELGKAATPAVSILQSTERVANVIGTTLSKTKPSFTIARPNLAISGQQFSFNNLRTSIVFPGAGIRDTLASFRNRESLPQIHLPQAFLRAAKGIEASLDDDTVEVVNVVMNNMENYLPSDVIKQDKDVEEEPEETFPASRVISSQILGYDGGEVDTKERVEVTFPVNVKSKSLPVPPGKVKQFRCAFFNFKAEEGNQTTGGWSYRGVETDVINTTHVRCIASHLTSFAVLVSIVPSVGEPPALDYITYIGCSISLLCLLASIIFYLTLRKELIHKLHNFVHLNLCIALSLGLLFFLTGIQTATANIYACKVMTALLHYFFLATFTWTLCEAILIYILLVKVFGANDRKWIYLYLALGWVLPIPVVVITGGARHDYYLIRASFDQSHPHYNSIKACWLPTENGVIFAFIGPMVAILLVNAVLLTISLVSLARSQCGRVSSRNDEKRQKYMEVGKQLLKTTIILVPLLGFTWIIGLFAVGEEGKAFAYLFVFANVFQGVFIFVLHILRHEKVYGKIKGKLPNISKLVTAYTGSASSSAKTTHASTSDTRKVSFALESEAIIESGVKKDEDAESIKDGDDQDIKLDVIYEDIQDVEGNGCEEAHAVATTALDMSADTTGALEGTEEKAKGDSTEDRAGQTCAEFTSGEQSGNEAGGVVDNN